MKLFERELAGRGGAALPAAARQPAYRGSIPTGDLDYEDEPTQDAAEAPATQEVAMANHNANALKVVKVDEDPAGQPVNLFCDACGRRFQVRIKASDLPAGEDTDRAAALCDPCLAKLDQLFRNRDLQPAPYLEFKQRVGESVARKLGIVPFAN